MENFGGSWWSQISKNRNEVIRRLVEQELDKEVQIFKSRTAQNEKFSVGNLLENYQKYALLEIEAYFQISSLINLVEASEEEVREYTELLREAKLILKNHLKSGIQEKIRLKQETINSLERDITEEKEKYQKNKSSLAEARKNFASSQKERKQLANKIARLF